MDSITYTNPKSKLRFFAFYLAAIALVFFVVSSFWQHNPFNFRPANAVDNSVTVQNDALIEVEKLKMQLAEKDNQIAALQNAAQLKPSSSNSAASTSATADQKDKLIASLQNQLAQKEAALLQAQSGATSGSNDAEWKQKYTALKASFDKLSANEKELKNAYKTVADDNRRLLTQLESLRKG